MCSNLGARSIRALAPHRAVGSMANHLSMCPIDPFAGQPPGAAPRSTAACGARRESSHRVGSRMVPGFFPSFRVEQAGVHRAGTLRRGNYSSAQGAAFNIPPDQPTNTGAPASPEQAQMADAHLGSNPARPHETRYLVALTRKRLLELFGQRRHGLANRWYQAVFQPHAGGKSEPLESAVN